MSLTGSLPLDPLNIDPALAIRPLEPSAPYLNISTFLFYVCQFMWIKCEVDSMNMVFMASSASGNIIRYDLPPKKGRPDMYTEAEISNYLLLCILVKTQ